MPLGDSFPVDSSSVTPQGFTIDTIRRPTRDLVAVGGAFATPIQTTGDAPKSDASTGLFILPSAGKLVGIYGAGSGDPGDTMIVQVSALRRLRNQVALPGSGQNPALWVEDPLVQWRFTLGAVTGVAGGVVSDNEVWATDVGLVNDWTGGRVARKPLTGGGGALACGIVDLFGAPFFVLRVGAAGEASAAGGWAPLYQEMSR